MFDGIYGIDGMGGELRIGNRVILVTVKSGDILGVQSMIIL
jgi:hypothetical protein